MKLAQTKIELAQQILETNDKALISKIKELFDEEQNEWWNKLPITVQESITESLSQIESNNTFSNTDAFKRFKKWQKK
jgi:hypothetical protein